jgi:hypothetical protein
MSAVSGYFGAEAQKDSAKDAAKAQKSATKDTNKMMMNMFNISRDDTAGQRSLFDDYAMPEWQKMFENGLKPDIDMNMDNDEIFQATRAESEKSLNRRQGAIGKYSSSDADSAITRNMSGLLTDSYNRQMTENQTGYNRLLDASKIGSGAAAQAGQNAIATGGNIGSNMMAAGNAQAQSALAQGQAQANWMNTIGQTGQNAYMMWKLFGNNGGGGGQTSGRK